MEPQGRNAVTVLIASLAMFAGSFRLDLPERLEELPYDYFLWGALVFGVIVARDFLQPRYTGVADHIRPRPHSQVLLVILTVLVIGNVVTRLAMWRIVQRLPEYLRDTEENGRQAIFLFVLSVLILFAKDLSTEAAWSATARTNRFWGCLGHMLFLSVLALVVELVPRNVLRYPDLLSNQAIVFVASLGLVMLIREGIRSLRARTENHRLPGNHTR